MPPVTAESMLQWCQNLLRVGPSGAPLSWEDYLAAIPRLESLADLPSGTQVLVRGDVDAKPGPTVGEGDIRLRSMKETLQFGRDRGWKQIVFGHIGRKPEGSLTKVATRLGEILGCQVPLISGWLDPATLSISDATADAVRSAEPGSVLMLENTRQYPIETVLWKAKAEDLVELAPQLAALARQFADRIARVYIHEALSAGSMDTSSTIVPAAMDRVAMGSYEYKEFNGPMRRCLAAQLVVFSGLKADKLDDLEAMINRGTVRWVFTAGSLAMALKKAAAELDGQSFSLGVAEDPGHANKPYFIPRERIEQAKRMIAEGRSKGIEFVLPVDFVLQNGQVAEQLGPGDQQLDIGPRTSELFERKVGEFIEHAKKADGEEPPAAFHNGVFGMFEDPRFEEGTRRFMSQLKRMKDAGVQVYVGGGEGGAALDKYGDESWVTHVFTAGGTVLNAMGNEPIPYLVALRMAAR